MTRVNISYAVELDELVEKVKDLLRGTSHRLHNINKDFERLVNQFDETSLMENIEDIDKYRQALALVDSQMADYSAILAGYLSTKAELYLAEQERERQMAGEVSPEAQTLLDQIAAAEHEEEDENDFTE